jgi:Tol biopolymer transport system component
MNMINAMRLPARADPKIRRTGFLVLLSSLLLVGCHDAPFTPPWTPPEPPPPEEPTPPAEPRIAFVSNRDGNPEIYTMREDGSEVRRLTDHPARDHSPTWSPDRRLIAFVSDRQGDEQQIYVMRFDGSQVRRLTRLDGPNHSPAWSPDGRRLAYVSEREGNQEIYLMDAAGDGVVRLTQDATNDFDPAWSPDGRRIIFASERDAEFLDGRADLYVMNADGSEVTRLTWARDPMMGFYFRRRSPAWSRDGSRIAFVANWTYPITSPMIHVMNADGSGRAQIQMRPLAYAAEPWWSADGSRIVFTGAPHPAEPHLFAMNPDGSGVTQLSTHPAAYQNREAVWSPDGSRLAFVSDRTGTAEIFLMKGDGSGVVRVPNTQEARAPLWSRDGTRLAFTSERSGNSDVYTIRPDGSGLRNLTDDPAPDRLVCWLSTERLAFLRQSADMWTLFLVGSDGSEPTVLLSDGYELQADCSPDGRSMVVVRRGARDGELLVVNTDGSGSRKLIEARAGYRYPRWSPDGSRVLVSWQPDYGGWMSASLQVVGVESGQVTIAGNSHGMFIPRGAWSPDGSMIASLVGEPTSFTSSGAPELRIRVVTASGGNVALVTRFPGGPPTWSPDGRWVTYTRSGTEVEHPYSQVADVNLSSPDARVQRRLTHGTPFSADAAWSP